MVRAPVPVKPPQPTATGSFRCLPLARLARAASRRASAAVRDAAVIPALPSRLAASIAPSYRRWIWLASRSGSGARLRLAV